MNIGGTVLLLTKPRGIKEAWGSIREICNIYPVLPYKKLSRIGKKKFPIKFVDDKDRMWIIEHLKFRTKSK